MLFMNIARKYLTRSVFQEEAGGEGGQAAAAAAGEPGAGAEPAEASPTPGAEAKPNEPDAVEVERGAAWDSVVAEYAEGKPALAVALGFIKDAGFSLSDPAIVAAEDGDLTLLKAQLAAKGTPGAEHMLAIIEAEIKANTDAIHAHEDATTAIVDGILGADKDAILEWARTNANDEEREQFNNMLECGGVYARALSLLLQTTYYEQTGATKAAANPVNHSAAAQSQGGGPLSARDYAAQVDALASKLGGDPRGHRDYAALTARREQGRKRGI